MGIFARKSSNVNAQQLRRGRLQTDLTDFKPMLNARIQGVSLTTETRLPPFYRGYEKGGKLELIKKDPQLSMRVPRIFLLFILLVCG